MEYRAMFNIQLRLGQEKCLIRETGQDLGAVTQTLVVVLKSSLLLIQLYFYHSRKRND